VQFTRSSFTGEETPMDTILSIIVGGIAALSGYPIWE
jgi:hypothetical protein